MIPAVKHTPVLHNYIHPLPPSGVVWQLASSTECMFAWMVDRGAPWALCSGAACTRNSGLGSCAAVAGTSRYQFAGAPFCQALPHIQSVGCKASAALQCSTCMPFGVLLNTLLNC